MPAPPLPKSDDRRSPSKRTSSPQCTSSPAVRGEPSLAVSRSKSYDSPTRSISSKTSVSVSGETARGGRKPGTSRRASLSLGGTDHSRASRKGNSTETESITSAADRKKVNRPGTVSPFLKNTHRELKDQITVLHGHIKFIQDLAIMSDSKKVDVLFKMIDRDGGGTVDAEELATAMRQNAELSFSDSIEKAIDMVATFDVNGDGELDKKEFSNYVSMGWTPAQNLCFGRAISRFFAVWYIQR